MGNESSRRLIIDHQCFTLLNHILDSKDLSSQNFSADNITVLDGSEKDLNSTGKMNEDLLIYVTRPNKTIFNSIVQIHLMLKGMRPELKENIIFIPGQNYDILNYLNVYRIKSDFGFYNLNFDLIPIDIDLLSLEREDCIKELYADKNLTIIGDLSNALAKLETIFGTIKYKYIKGDLSLNFCKALEEKEKEYIIKPTNDILALVAIDRSVDFMTLMSTNYTCEGSIDDIFGINLGRIKIKESILKANLTAKPITSNKISTYGLTTEFNKFYCRFRCMHFTDASKYLIKIRQYFQDKLLSKESKQTKLSTEKLRMYTEELQVYMTTIKENLIMTENIVKHIIESRNDTNYLKYIQKEQSLLAGELPDNLHELYHEHLSKQKDIFTLLKLMVLESLTQNGIKDYQNLKREILNIYGFQNIFLFRDLESIGWLQERQSSLRNLKKNILNMTYAQIMDKFELISKSLDPQIIEDCSYVLGGFCPLSLKIIQHAVEGKWNKINDSLKKLPGATIFPEDESAISNPKDEYNIIFIVFVGGITYTEIEGIRFLNRKLNEEYKNKKRKKTQLIILTTGILNCKKIFGGLGTKFNQSMTIKQFAEQDKSHTKK